MIDSALKRIRLAGGYKQSDFNHIGISQQLVSAIETGRMPMSERAALLLADEFGVEASEVLNGPRGETIEKLKTQKKKGKKIQASLTGDEMAVVSFFRSLPRENKKQFLSDMINKWY